MKNLKTRFLAKHCASLALVLTEHRLHVSCCMVVIGVFFIAGAGFLLFHKYQHYGFSEWTVSNMETMLRIGFGAYCLAWGLRNYAIAQEDEQQAKRDKAAQEGRRVNF